MSPNKLCVGLTGGIGSGKSTVAQEFAARGAIIIDTDAIAHQLTQSGGCAIAQISAAFGADYISPSGAMDRSKMRNLVFADADAKNQLENILHPLILAACKEQLSLPGTSPYAMLMAPLLLDCPDFLQLVQRILVIDCSEAIQISRVMKRSGLEESQIRAIIAQQSSRARRLACADDVIQNDGNIADLTAQVNNLHLQYQQSFDGKPIFNISSRLGI